LSSRLSIVVARSAIAGLSLLLDTGLNVAAAQTKLDAAYTATLLGFPIGKISWTVELRENRFAAAASGAISGLLRIFSDGHGEVTAHGTLLKGRPVNSNFALRIFAGKWSDEVRILFNGNGVKEYFTSAPAQPSKVQIPLTDASLRGAMDPMAALLVYIPGAGETIVRDACERDIAVFDGHTRYDLRLGFSRFDKVKTDRGYQGAVVVCAVKFLPVAGYDPKHFLVTYLAAQRDIEIWLAPIAGTRFLAPYRMSMRTPMGLGVLQATRFESLPAEPTPRLN
jgi:hypothetical protein